MASPVGVMGQYTAQLRCPMCQREQTVELRRVGYAYRYRAIEGQRCYHCQTPLDALGTTWSDETLRARTAPASGEATA